MTVNDHSLSILVNNDCKNKQSDVTVNNDYYQLLLAVKYFEHKIVKTRSH